MKRREFFGSLLGTVIATRAKFFAEPSSPALDFDDKFDFYNRASHRDLMGCTCHLMTDSGLIVATRIEQVARAYRETEALIELKTQPWASVYPETLVIHGFAITAPNGRFLDRGAFRHLTYLTPDATFHSDISIGWTNFRVEDYRPAG